MTIATTAQAGGHHGSPQPVYLVPTVPVMAFAPAPAAYAPPMAYAPAAYAPVAYAPPAKHHKAKNYAYPVAAYAPAPAYYYGAAQAPPATYNLVPYAAQAPAAAPAAAAPAAAAPAPAMYQWKLVKTSGAESSAAAPAAAAPGTDTDLAGLSKDQSEKVVQLVKDRLDSYSKTSMSSEKKRDELIRDAGDFYADELGKPSSSLTTAEREDARSLALSVLGEQPEAKNESTSEARPPTGGAAPTYLVPAYAPAVYQLFLPQPAQGGLFHHKYR
ncbi:hypothetical protein P12x_003351 [Tundrisphaera lichenicola]|uniref:hypothetical protein n=1 Tax=Tundrisphaera lichenicola TaxID=2029860 RepID=UPI003EBDA96F